MENFVKDSALESELKRVGSHDFDGDSGLENTSESGNSCDENCFSSTESLARHTPTPCPKKHVVTRSKSLDERDITKYFQKEIPVRAKTPDVAVLNLEPESLSEKLDEQPDIDLERLPTYFQELWLGKQESADFEVPLNEKPPWYNEEKFKRGQKFAKEYLFCINFAETVSLYLIFALKTALEPLIFTGRSDTPYKAFQRYLSTFTRVLSWYEEDPWSEGSTSQRNLAAVRVMHRNVQKRMLNATPDEMRRRGTVSSSGPVWSTLRPVLLDDFRSSCPVPAPGTCPNIGHGIRVNQFDMAITQFAFVGLAVTYPKKFGIHYATDEDLEGFLHMWQTLGYILGIHDKYNFCADLPTVRQRTQDFINLSVKSALRDVTPDWEHMSRCLTQGIAFYVPGMEFETSLKYVCKDVLNLHTPRLSKKLTFWQSLMCGMLNFTFAFVFRLPALRRFFTRAMMKGIRKAQDASPQLLRKWETREFPYMKQGTGENIEDPVKTV